MGSAITGRWVWQIPILTPKKVLFFNRADRHKCFFKLETCYRARRLCSDVVSKNSTSIILSVIDIVVHAKGKQVGIGPCVTTAS